MIQGVQVHGGKRRKAKKKSLSLRKAEADMEKFYAKMGIDTNKKSEHRNEIPDYDTGPRVTSDQIAGNGTKKEANQYTGDYIIGLGQMHKSNSVPITRKQDAVAIANMRR